MIFFKSATHESEQVILVQSSRSMKVFILALLCLGIAFGEYESPAFIHCLMYGIQSSKLGQRLEGEAPHGGDRLQESH